MIITGDVFEQIAQAKDTEYHTIFCDPPYNLASEFEIINGHPEIKGKAVDFMDKWEGLDGVALDKMFTEFFRVLKFGGYCVMFGMDRQAWAFQYYAVKAGFEVCQSLQWFFISSFSKGSNGSKKVDSKYFREWLDEHPSCKARIAKFNLFLNGRKPRNGKPRVIGYKDTDDSKRIIGYSKATDTDLLPSIPIYKIDRYTAVLASYVQCCERRAGTDRETFWYDRYKDGKTRNSLGSEHFNLTSYDSGGNGNTTSSPATPLAGKFDGYAYGRAPLKQCSELVMVFRKPPLNKSVIADLMALQDNLDNPLISPAVVNIDGGRVPTDSNVDDMLRITKRKPRQSKTWENGSGFKNETNHVTGVHSQGRYPPTIFIDSKAAAECIDRQSGVLTSGFMKAGEYPNSGTWFAKGTKFDKDTYGDSGGASRVLHKVDYEDHDHDIYLYEPKVSKSERMKGIEFSGLISDEVERNDNINSINPNIKGRKCNPIANISSKSEGNFHPTLKPISLIYRIATLFRLPDECNQKVLIPFAGVMSEYIGFLKAGFTEEQLTAIEINPEYVEIGKARVVKWKADFRELSRIQEFDL